MAGGQFRPVAASWSSHWSLFRGLISASSGSGGGAGHSSSPLGAPALYCDGREGLWVWASP